MTIESTTRPRVDVPYPEGVIHPRSRKLDYFPSLQKLKPPPAPEKSGQAAAKKELPSLPPPDYAKSTELQFMWIDHLFQQVQKRLGAFTRSHMGRIQEAQKELLKKNLENLDVALEKVARERRARKRAAVFGLLKKIAAVVVIAVAVVAVAATATLTVGTGAFLAVGLLSFAGAFIDMVGAGSAATQGRGFTLATLLKDAGVRHGSEALAAGISMDAGGLTSETLKESGLKSEAIMAISIAVTVVQALVMNRCSTGLMAPDKMSRLMKTCIPLLRDFSTVFGGFSQSMSGTHTLQAAAFQKDGTVARSHMAMREADRTELDQSIAQNLEFMKALLKASEQSFANLKRMMDESWATLSVLSGPTGRTASLA